MVALTREPSGRRASPSAGLVDVPAHPGSDALDDPHQMLGIAELDRRFLQFAEPLDVTVLGLFTRMSVTAGSAMRGASGPTPVVSSRRSSTSRRRSASLRARSSSARTRVTKPRTKGGQGFLAGGEQIGAIDLVEQSLVQGALDVQIFRPSAICF